MLLSGKTVPARMAALVFACLISVGILSGCSNASRSVFKYQVPESTEEFPQEYPNVYTSISRDDELRTVKSRSEAVAELEGKRALHVETTREQIAN